MLESSGAVWRGDWNISLDGLFEVVPGPIREIREILTVLEMQTAQKFGSGSRSVVGGGREVDTGPYVQNGGCWCSSCQKKLYYPQ